MANHQNAATLGVALSLETGNFVTEANKVAYETQKMKNAIAREMKAADKEIKALQYATEDYGKAVSKVTQIERELASGRLKDIKGSAKAQELLAQAAAYDKVANAAKNATGAQFKMNEQQKINLTYQTTDLFTQIASGQSPFIAIIQQGGQLKDAMGGVGNMFRAIGTLFTPFSVALGAVAVAVGSVGYAFYKAADELAQFKDAMTLTGGFSGLTYENLLKLGDTLSTKTNVAIGSARDVMQELAASGKFTGQSLEAVGSVILRFSKLTGQDAKEATASLIPLLDGTASSAKQLNEKYHFLTLEQYKQIKALEKQGKLQESILMQAKLLDKSFGDNRRELGYLETAWGKVAKAASWAWDSMMGWGRDDKAKDLQKLNQEIALATAAVNTPGNRMTQARDADKAKLDSLLEQRKLLLKSMLMEEEAAKEKAKAAEKNAKGIREEDKYGPMAITKASELAKAKAEAEFARAKEGAGEIILLELEKDKKLKEAKREMDEKNQQEDSRFTSQNLEIYQSKEILIAAETAEKIKKIRAKYAIAQFNEEEERAKADELTNSIEDARIRTMRKSEQDRTIELDYQRQSLDLKYQMIYATETEQKLAQISLEYARKRKEVEGQDSDTIKELNRQEEIRKMFVTMEEGAKRTQQVFDTVWGGLSEAIDNFVKTGKLNMKDFARSTIQSLLAIELKAASMKFLRSAFSMYSGGGWGSGNAFGNQDLGGYLADGGPAAANTPYVVGERGPEIFVPNSAGTVIPNHSLTNMGGTTNVTNNYINAIDAKSFENRLLESSNTIWAGYQYANKQLASNGRRA